MAGPRFGLHLAAALAGAGGMGLQAVWLGRAGLMAGQSAAGAYGPGAYVAGWALGAALAGRSRASVRRGALVGAALTIAGAALAEIARRFDGAGTLRALVALGCVAVASGYFLPLAARASAAARVGALLSCNLLGCLLGAWFVGWFAVSEWGRAPAAGIGLLALMGAFGLLGKFSNGGTYVASAPATPDRLAQVLVALTTLWGLGLEWVCARVAVMWIGSEASQLLLVVAISLLALALGSAVAQRIPLGRLAISLCLAACALGSTWPLFAAGALQWARAYGDVAMALVLVVPTMAPLGAVVPCLHALGEGESGRRLGDLYAAEVAGGLAAGPLVHAFVLPHFGIRGTIALLVVLGAALACVVAWRAGARRAVALLALFGALLGALAASRVPPALFSPKLTDPVLTVRSFREDEHFSVAVVDDGILGERTLLTDQFRAAGNGPDYRYMRALGHLPVLLHPEPERVAVLALGTGTTLGAVSLHDEVRSIDVLEISSAVVAAAPLFDDLQRGALGDHARVRVIIDDGRRTLAGAEARYDVLTMEPLLPDSPFGVYLYTPEFYEVARRALRPGGVYCQWIPPHAVPPETLDALLAAFGRSFPDTRVWLFGTQLLLTGTEGEPRVREERLRALGANCRASLVQLGLDTTDGIASRHVASLAAWEGGTRALLDDDPWIAWRAKASGTAVLAWLPANLERLQQQGSRLSWGDPARDSALVVLREARIAHGWAELAARRGESSPEAPRERALEALAALDPAGRRDPEVLAFREELEFTASLRRGVAALGSGDVATAVREVVTAAELRPERGDVHAYAAAALHAAGDLRAARSAAQKALQSCPQIARTPAGARAMQLGLPADWLAAR